MRTTSMKTVYFTEDEVKQALTNFVRDKQGTKLGLYAHMMNSECSMEWVPSQNEFVVSIDGEIDD